MAAFLYFIPDGCLAGSKPTLAELGTLGLSHVFDDPPTVRAVSGGPEGQNGLVASTCDDLSHLKYDATAQQWVQFKAGNVWLGWWKERKPTPEDLQRDKQLDGAWLKTDDGNRWLVPHARRYGDEIEGQLWSACSLPQRFSLNDDGEWVLSGVKPRYSELWRLVCDYETAIYSGTQDGEVVRFTFPEINTLAVSGLSANYRVSLQELNAMEVYDQEARDGIIAILRDEATWTAWAKKKQTEQALDGGASSSGADVSTPASEAPTAPQSQTGADTTSDCTPEPAGVS